MKKDRDWIKNFNQNEYMDKCADYFQRKMYRIHKTYEDKKVSDIMFKGLKLNKKAYIGYGKKCCNDRRDIENVVLPYLRYLWKLVDVLNKLCRQIDKYDLKKDISPMYGILTNIVKEIGYRQNDIRTTL